MNIGVTQWTLDKQGVAGLARASELGFNALQLGAGMVDDSNLSEYLSASQETGIKLLSIGVNSANNISLLGSASDRDKGIAFIEQAIVRAKALSIPLVYVPAFGASEMKTDADIKTTAHILSDLATHAAEQGIEFASENTLNAPQQLELLALADNPNLKLFFDTQNPVLWGHDSAQLVIDLKDQLCSQLHLKDGKDGQMGNSLLGEGEAKFFETVKAIKKLERDFVFISETDYSIDAELRAAKDIATIRQVFASDA